MLGRYLDALPEEARQRVRIAARWTTDDYVRADGARCLLGHAENWYWDELRQEPNCAAPDLLELRSAAGDDWLNWPPLLGKRFDHLVERAGLELAVALIRVRASRPTAVRSEPGAKAPASV